MIVQHVLRRNSIALCPNTKTVRADAETSEGTYKTKEKFDRIDLLAVKHVGTQGNISAA